MPAAPSSWSELHARALAFGRRARDPAEDPAALWRDLLGVFGRGPEPLETLARWARRHDRAYDSADLVWPGVLVAERRERGQDLGPREYGRPPSGAGSPLAAPRHLLVSDPEQLALHDLDRGTCLSFPAAELHRHVHALGFLAGRRAPAAADDETERVVAERMARLHVALRRGESADARLDRLLARLAACFYAEDAGIFPPGAFTALVVRRSAPDGRGLSVLLAELFQVLGTAERPPELDPDLASLPPIRGGLFADALPVADFDGEARARLLECAGLDWSRLDPSALVSLAQELMDPAERRQLGAHYTRARAIDELLGDLFVAELEAELADALTNQRTRSARLRALHERLLRLRVLDPACGCGNFLILAYRALRRLEAQILGALADEPDPPQARVSPAQLHGLELAALPAQLARLGVAWTERLLDLERADGAPDAGAPQIVEANALRLDWRALLPPSDAVVVVGNPPFVGKQRMSPEQSADAAHVWAGSPAAGVLDFAACWFRRAAEYVHGTRARVAFVATSSLSQGEQPGALWPELAARWRTTIHFARRGLPWAGAARVQVVVIGFAAHDRPDKWIVDASDGRSPGRLTAAQISPYLLPGPDLALLARPRPLARVPDCQYGSKPADGGHLLLSAAERDALARASPELAPWIRPLVCAEQFLRGTSRWCLWLVEAPPDILSHPALAPRLGRVAAFRRASAKPSTQGRAAHPALFAEVRQPSSAFLVVPLHTSEARRYIPFGYLTPDHVVHNSCSFVPGAAPFHFGVLSSALHMTWVRAVCGRLEGRYRYSTRLVYNNFPWPDDATEEQRAAVTSAAQRVLAARTRSPGASLADLYDPGAAPAPLLQAHAALDRAVERCYRAQPFASDAERLGHLFARYRALAAPCSTPGTVCPADTGF